MKPLILSIIVLCGILFLFLPKIAAQGQGDPFNWTEPVKVESNDIYLQWLEEVTPGVVKSYQKVYRFKIDSTWLPPDQLITKSPRQEDSRGGIGYIDAASGRFNVDSFDDLVSVWEGYTAIQIMLPQFDTTEALWTTAIKDSIVNPAISPVEANRLYVRTLDVDGDSLDEFIVAYLDAQDSVHFNLYDVDTTLTPALIASFTDTKVIAWLNYHFVRFFIETGDFDGDGTDELALFAAESLPAGQILIEVKIYDFVGGEFVPKGVYTITMQRECAGNFFQMAATSGQFKISDEKDELAFVAIYQNCGLSNWRVPVLLEVSSDLQTISVGSVPVSIYDQGSNPPSLSLASGDLNNNGRDELVVHYSHTMLIYESNDNLDLTLSSDSDYVFPQGLQDYTQSYNFLKVGDMNQDKRGDVILMMNYVQIVIGMPIGFAVSIFSYSDNFERVLIAELLADEQQYDFYQPFAIAVGNFDGNDFTIGQPLHHTKNNVTQPMVILNAPPIHFDVLNGQTYDINSCYNGGNCDFFSKYVKTNTNSVEVSTKVHKEWVATAGWRLSGSVSINSPLNVVGATFNYESYLLGKYGKHFSSDSTNITTVTVGVEVLAKEDDQIYATVTNYELWEYPLYYGNEDFPRAGIMTMVPNNVRGQWFPSKSYYALSYIPDHEVGNILSYYPYDTLINNPNVNQTIRANYVSDSFTLSANTSYDWFLKRSDFTSSQADTSVQMGLEVGYSFGTTFSSAISDKKYSTHKTSVTQQIELRSHLGSVNMGLGDVKYTVTPYAYWSKIGPLVVDYAVKPELAPPGFPNTWWQDHYSSLSDPTLVLPWRLDPEKGFSISEEAKRHQTNDIAFYPKDPLPADTITITARVRNYSLIATPSPVSVKFYIGDPDSGGVPIIGVNGTNTVSTNGPISHRGRSDVEFKWVLPAGLPPFPRIYAVLDQENAITEIHEINNKGFNVLGREIVVGVEDENNILPEEYVLYQSYPNPFNPTATISYDLPKAGVVTIKVFNILGQEIVTLAEEFKNAGKHSIQFNGNGLSSGVYLYRIQTGDFMQTRKMLLLK